MPELTADALAQFEKAVTDDQFMERLLSFALRRKRALYWRGVWDGHLPDGKGVADIVQEAITDVVHGKRAWNPEKHPDLLQFMRSVVNSKISGLRTSAENMNVKLFVATRDDDRDPLETLPDGAGDNASIQLQEQEDEARNSDIILLFFDFVASDKLVQGIVGCTIEGITKRAEIAASLKVKEQDITNAHKRLERYFKDFRKSHADKNPFKFPRTEYAR